MFGTVICYLAVRLLGGNKDEEWIKKGREFIQQEGGAVMTSSWAKFWLCLVGCMDWKGHNSVPPEMWLLPNWFPFHPGRLWCHCRMVYLPMGYLYGSRFVYSRAETDPLIKELRKEVCQYLFMLKCSMIPSDILLINTFLSTSSTALLQTVRFDPMGFYSPSCCRYGQLFTNTKIYEIRPELPFVLRKLDGVSPIPRSGKKGWTKVLLGVHERGRFTNKLH